MASEPDPPELDAEWFKNARRHRGGVPIDPAPEAVREIARRLRHPHHTRPRGGQAHRTLMLTIAIAFIATAAVCATFLAAADAFTRSRQALDTAREAADAAVAALDATHSLAALLAQRRGDDARMFRDLERDVGERMREQGHTPDAPSP